MLPLAARPSNRARARKRVILCRIICKGRLAHTLKKLHVCYVSARGRSSRHVVRLRRLPCAAYFSFATSNCSSRISWERPPARPSNAAFFDAWRRQSSSVLQQKAACTRVLHEVVCTGAYFTGTVEVFVTVPGRTLSMCTRCSIIIVRVSLLLLK